MKLFPFYQDVKQQALKLDTLNHKSRKFTPLIFKTPGRGSLIRTSLRSSSSNKSWKIGNN